MGAEGKYELVDGKLVYIAPAGFGHTHTVDRVCDTLLRYEEATHAGYALADGIGYLVNLPRRQLFSPDASFSAAVPEDEEDFITGAPLFAAEIRSKGDYGAAGDAAAPTQRDDYFGAGTQAIWDVNPRERTITLYTPDTVDNPRVFHSGEIADAEPALPGWRVAVDTILPPRPRVTRPA